MYKVLVVDDEKIERKGISFLLKGMNIECDLDEAVNGVAALKYLEEKNVDILLTDVKMPHMDGIELIKSIKDKGINPSMKIVIISGYSDFEYAKLAVRLGASDYILKPIDPKEFENSICKLISEIDNERKEQDVAEKSIEFLRQHYLYALVNGMKMEMLKDMKLPGLDFAGKYSRLMIIEFEKGIFSDGDGEFVGNLSSAIEHDVKYQYLNLNSDQCVIFFEGQDKDCEFYRNVAGNIISMINKKHGVKAYVAISASFCGEDKIPSAFEETESLMDNRFYDTQECIYMADVREESPSSSVADDDTIMKQMKQDIKMKDMENLRIHFDKMCMKYKIKTDFSQVYVKFIFSNLLKSFYDAIPDVGESELDGEVEKLYRASEFQTVIEIINKNIGRLEEYFGKSSQSAHREVESVKQYIYKHYGEELGVEQLADMVYMAPSYLSCVFKKETGQNLSKFIKAYRMEKAKEMLEDTHMKIVAISNQVGYSNVSYFCQSFREYFGISPQKYRSQGES